MHIANPRFPVRSLDSMPVCMHRPSDLDGGTFWLGLGCLH